MSNGFRRGLSLLFIVAFLISAPAVVLYTAGYRLNIQNGRVVQTGILSVDSAPRDARIFVDGTAEGTTPALVKDLLPGLHRLTLAKDGYLAWEKSLPVDSRQTTFVNPAVLSADQPAVAVRETPLVPTAFARATVRAAYVRHAATADEAWAYDARDGSDRLVARLPSQIGTPTLDWSPDGSSLAIASGTGSARGLSLVNATDGRHVNVPPSEGTPEGWDAGSDASYLFSNAGGFFGMDVDGRTTALGSAAASLRSSRDGTDEAVAANGRTVVALRRGTDATVIGELSGIGYAFVPSPDGLLALADAARGRLSVLDAGGGAGSTLLDANATAWQWEPDGQRLLYTDGHELHLFDPADRSDEMLTRVSDPITGLAWRPGLPAALYAQAGQLVSIEFDRRDGRVTSTLAQGADIHDVWTDVSGKTAYFFGTVGGKTGLMARTLE